MSARATFVVVLFPVLAVLACTKSDPTTTEPPIATATSSVGTAAPSASAIASAAPSAAESATADTAKKPDAGVHAVASASPSDAGGGACGTKPLPDCPLQAWMKANANPPVMSSDLPALGLALDKIIAFAPAGYTNWVSISKDGAAAARSGDLPAAKAACRTCHEQYKEKYKTEMRTRKI